MRFLAFATLFALAACSGTPAGLGSYDALDNQTSFQSADIPLGKSAQGNYASTTSFALRSVGECIGRDCEPETFELALLNKTISATALSDEIQVVFSTEAGSITIDPTQSGSNEISNLSSGRGEVLRIRIPRDIFVSFANAQSLDIRFGGSLYKIPYSARSSMRRMLEPAS